MVANEYWKFCWSLGGMFEYDEKNWKLVAG